MKCEECGNLFEITLKDKNPGKPCLFVQVMESVACPKCGFKNNLEIPLSKYVEIPQQKSV